MSKPSLTFAVIEGNKATRYGHQPIDLIGRPPLFFDSSFTTEGAMGSYADFNPDDLVVGGSEVYAEGTAPSNLDIWLSPDPLSPDRVVCCADARNGKHTGNIYPRAGLTTGLILTTGQEYWQSLSWLSTDKLPNDDWNSIFTAGFGPPWDGPSPTSMAEQPSSTPGKNLLRFSRTPATGGINWPGEEISVNQWTHCILHLRLAEAPNGWVEMWLNTGPGPNDFRKVLPMQAVSTVAPGSTGGNYSSIGPYGITPHRTYFGHHQIATGPDGYKAFDFDNFGTKFDPRILEDN